MTTNEKRYISVEQAAEYLRVHPETIRRLLRDGKLAGKKALVNRWRVDWQDLLRLERDYHVEG